MYLHRYFKFYVPGTNGGVLDAGLQQRKANEVMEEFATMFGGATVTKGQGAWVSGSGKLVKEPVILVESFTDESSYQRHQDDVRNLASRLAAEMGQESVAYEDCGRLFLVQPERVEANEEALAA